MKPFTLISCLCCFYLFALALFSALAGMHDSLFWYWWGWIGSVLVLVFCIRNEKPVYDPEHNEGADDDAHE